MSSSFLQTWVVVLLYILLPQLIACTLYNIVQQWPLPSHMIYFSPLLHIKYLNDLLKAILPTIAGTIQRSCRQLQSFRYIYSTGDCVSIIPGGYTLKGFLYITVFCIDHPRRLVNPRNCPVHLYRQLAEDNCILEDVSCRILTNIQTFKKLVETVGTS